MSFIEKAKKRHGDRYDYSKVIYKKASEKIEIICKEHGSFIQTASGHLCGCGCPKCAKMGFSQKAIRWLESIMNKENIYIRHAMNDSEYRIPTTRYRADGFCKETNTIYEFHGTIYHGDPRICGAGESNYLGKKYEHLYEKTLEKENKIRELGYNLIVMWEHDFDNQEDNESNGISDLSE
jgi:G:T-mismatch repair DNA endonuclease (very short patch repair protein)